MNEEPQLQPVLVLCHGNINRSPACAEVLRVCGVPAVSAGLNIGNIRRSVAAKKMRDVMEPLGFDLSAHLAQPVTRELCDGASCILIMDNGNERRMREFAAGYDVGILRKVRRLGAYADPKVDTIKDPGFMAKSDPQIPIIARQIIQASTAFADWWLATYAPWALQGGEKAL